MKNVTESVNKILSDWDPLNVGKDISSDEYKGYVPRILKTIKNKEQLTNCLESILIHDLETGYDKKNVEHMKSLNHIVEKFTDLVL